MYCVNYLGQNMRVAVRLTGTKIRACVRVGCLALLESRKTGA